MNQDLPLMDQLMHSITINEEWERRQSTDPGISVAEDRWEIALERVKPMLPTDLYMELADAHTCDVAATSDASILYGIHVADTIRDIAARPAELSRYVLENRSAG